MNERKEQAYKEHIKRLEAVLLNLWKEYSGNTDLRYDIPGWEEMGYRFAPLVRRSAPGVGAIVCRSPKEEDMYR